MNKSVINCLFVMIALVPVGCNKTADNLTVKYFQEGHKNPIFIKDANNNKRKINFNIDSSMLAPGKSKYGRRYPFLIVSGEIYNFGEDTVSINQDMAVIVASNGNIYHSLDQAEDDPVRPIKGDFGEADVHGNYKIYKAMGDNNMPYSAYFCMPPSAYKNDLYFALSAPGNPNKIQFKGIIYSAKGSSWDCKTYGVHSLIGPYVSFEGVDWKTENITPGLERRTVEIDPD